MHDTSGPSPRWFDGWQILASSCSVPAPSPGDLTWLGRVSRIASRPVRSGAQPDEDVGHTDRGRVADGELVKAGRHRAELLAPVHQPLHLIPVAVADPVKGGRAATPGTTTGPVGLLVVALGDGVGDPPSPQRGPVGPAGIGLVAGQMLGTHPGAGHGHPAGPPAPGPGARPAGWCRRPARA